MDKTIGLFLLNDHERNGHEWREFIRIVIWRIEVNSFLFHKYCPDGTIFVVVCFSAKLLSLTGHTFGPANSFLPALREAQRKHFHLLSL